MNLAIIDNLFGNPIRHSLKKLPPLASGSDNSGVPWIGRKKN